MSQENTTQTAESIKSGYDSWAAVYDHDANPLPALEEPIVRRLLGNVRGKLVLDLGCGTGRHTKWLAANRARVTGIDFSDSMLRTAQAKLNDAGVDFRLHDLHDPLPIQSATIAVVVSGLVLEHIRELQPWFREIRRVLRPGGNCVLSTLHPAMFLRGSQARFTDPATGAVVQPGSYPHSFADMIMAALNAGLHIRGISEHSPDATFAARFPRAEKYIGWPMLVVFDLQAPATR